MDELKLIRKAIKGNEKAFEKLLEIHSDRLYRTAYLYVGNRQDALDVLQEMAYRAFLAIRQLRDERYFLTWLTKILINCAYDVIKKRKKEVPAAENIIELIPGKREKCDEALDLIEAINRLNEQYRNAIILFYYQDLPLIEVAKLMNIPVNTVKTYLSRGKSQLKKLLGGDEYNGKETIS
ncbi:sigma-70 family RNA polymerase sigma factor [Neobacillus kokaensis]|uniref:DNA-directed RNA polymerase sigma-70 factor n=1 Tax=Neobacillus kokaensis TaxID=2759023 RepID=A0ABQ3NB64_9BACI|nr:sigma-70 family RNA polymerase sigma factor [Neobacillus kokaensis]GHI01142.1 DNA-directed RNA polymerase sigma-70 factor [Neobacillus kokaensis]